MKILVTGAAGFIGSHLVDVLLQKGNHEVFGIDNLSGGFMQNVNPGSRFTNLDLRDKEKTASYIAGIKPDLLFHLAADATEGRSQFTPISASENNYIGYLYTLVPAIKAGLKKVVLVSSMSVYGSQKPPFSEDMPKKPDDVYGVTKAGMEDVTEILSKVHGFTYTIIRPHNVYGPRQNFTDPYRNVVGIFLNCLLHNKRYYIYGKGEQKRAFTYIDDLAPYVAEAGFSDACNGEAINIGPEKEYSVNELSQAILQAWFEGKEVPQALQPEYLPLRPLEVVDAYCTNTKAKKLLGYKTSVPLEEGIKRTIIWAKSMGPQEFRYTPLELETGNVPLTWKKKLL